MTTPYVPDVGTNSWNQYLPSSTPYDQYWSSLLGSGSNVLGSNTGSYDFGDPNLNSLFAKMNTEYNGLWSQFQSAVNSPTGQYNLPSMPTSPSGTAPKVTKNSNGDIVYTTSGGWNVTMTPGTDPTVTITKGNQTITESGSPPTETIDGKQQDGAAGQWKSKDRVIQLPDGSEISMTASDTKGPITGVSVFDAVSDPKAGSYNPQEIKIDLQKGTSSTITAANNPSTFISDMDSVPNDNIAMANLDSNGQLQIYSSTVQPGSGTGTPGTGSVTHTGDGSYTYKNSDGWVIDVNKDNTVKITDPKTGDVITESGSPPTETVVDKSGKPVSGVGEGKWTDNAGTRTLTLPDGIVINMSRPGALPGGEGSLGVNGVQIFDGQHEEDFSYGTNGGNPDWTKEVSDPTTILSDEQTALQQSNQGYVSYDSNGNLQIGTTPSPGPGGTGGNYGNEPTQGTDKDGNQYVQYVDSQGWTVTVTSGQYPTVTMTSPDGKQTISEAGDPHESVDGKRGENGAESTWAKNDRVIQLPDGTVVDMNAAGTNKALTGVNIFDVDGSKEVQVDVSNSKNANYNVVADPGTSGLPTDNWAYAGYTADGSQLGLTEYGNPDPPGGSTNNGSIKILELNSDSIQYQWPYNTTTIKNTSAGDPPANNTQAHDLGWELEHDEAHHGGWFGHQGYRIQHFPDALGTWVNGDGNKPGQQTGWLSDIGTWINGDGNKPGQQTGWLSDVGTWVNGDSNIPGQTNGWWRDLFGV